MRDIQKVLSAMLAKVPEGEAELRYRLGKIAESAHYTAPDAMAVRWHQALTVLVDLIGEEPTESWQVEVARIFKGDDDVC